MSWAIAIIFVLVWALGLATHYTFNGLLHLLLLAAIFVVVVRMLQIRQVRKLRKLKRG